MTKASAAFAIDFINKTIRGAIYKPVSRIYWLVLILSIFWIDGTSQVIGDYRFNALSANWENSANWQSWNGIAWVAATDYPGQNAGTKKVTIQNNQRAFINVNTLFPIESLELSGNGPDYNNNANIARVTWQVNGCPLTVSGNLSMSYGSIRATAACRRSTKCAGEPYCK